MSAGIAPELLDALHARAEEGMREDAPEEAAEAREDLLTIYLGCHTWTRRLDPTLDDSHSLAGNSWMERSRREREMVWGDRDLRGLEWLDRLAECGHAGAKQLRARVFLHAAALAALAGRNPERVTALAQEVPTAGLAMARRELAKEAPALDELCRWLQSMHDCAGRDLGRHLLPGEEARGALSVLDIVREMRGISASADRIEIAFVREMLAPGEFERLSWRSAATGAALHRLAGLKLASPEPGMRATGEQLRARAAELGSEEAQDAILAESTDPKMVCRWLPTERASAVAEAVDLLRSVEGEPGEADLRVLHAARKGVDQLDALAAHGRRPFAAKLLFALARLRLDVAQAGAKNAGWALLEKAAERGSWAAQLELYGRSPDAELLARRLEMGGEPVVASALREFCAIAGQPEPPDLDLLGAAIASERLPDAGELLYELALARRQRGEGPANSLCERLVHRAAQLGSADAKLAVVMAAFEAAADRRAFVRAFLKQYPNAGPIADRLCLRLGGAAEKGELGAAPDLAEAVEWYARGLRKAPPAPAAACERDADFCNAVATAFDRRWRVHQVDDPTLALAWHARALAAGDDRSLRAWLEAFLGGNMGLGQDPGEALAQVRRFKSAGAAAKGALMQLGSKLRSRAGEVAQTDAALGARWYEIAAELGSGDAHYRIGCLYLKGDKGLARDGAAAQAWFEKGAQLGDIDCRLALVPEAAVLMGLRAGPVPPTEAAALDLETALVLGARLLGAGQKERAWQLLNHVADHGSAEQRDQVARLAERKEPPGPLGDLSSLEIV